MSQPRHVTLCDEQFDRPGHICAFFNSRDQQYDVLSPYYQEGIDQGEQVVTIVDGDQHDEHCECMRARGVDVDKAMTEDQLRVFTAENTYTAGGRFEATRMYDLLQGALASAQHHGRKVRTSGVMGWSTRGYPGTAELMDYEARVNVLVPIYDCTLLCVYDLSAINGEMVMQILQTHPYVIRGNKMLRNPYYTPPVEALKEALSELGPAINA